MTARFRSTVAAIARTEWRAMLRNQVAVAAGVLMLALTLAAILVSHERVRAVNAERARFQASADEQWHSQPDRHPHRVVHYGHYVFRPLSPLAFFDFGVDPFTGHTLFLEGHRQNSANFSDAGQSSVLLRFGQLTPAFVLQVLTPLLIVFLAFGSVARERERGQLRLQLTQGVKGTTLLAGKLAAHAAIAMLLASPAFVALGAIAVLHGAVAAEALAILAGYALYLLVWAVAAVLVSALLPRARDALLALVGGWIVTAILLPRVMPDFATMDIERPTRIETEVAIHERLKALGDSHDPDDPYFSRFRQQVLAKYGVARIEDLPVNYGGLVMQEGERLTSELFDEFMRADYERQTAQSGIVHRAALASPVIALRRMSTALAGTNLDSHTRFLFEGEKYRYRFVQALNRLHTTEIRYQNDRDQRVGKHHWDDTPRFGYAPAPFAEVAPRHAWPAFALLGGWLAALAVSARWVAQRLERTGK
ncbi:ABC transporter permease [Massilia consociata]|uniref:ABC transporter permease n=1 Tax=Massilia consociata TaxID=760117 RepID=A0ABV6FGT7_9BURK